MDGRYDWIGKVGFSISLAPIVVLMVMYPVLSVLPVGFDSPFLSLAAIVVTFGPPLSVIVSLVGMVLSTQKAGAAFGVVLGGLETLAIAFIMFMGYYCSV